MSDWSVRCETCGACRRARPGEAGSVALRARELERWLWSVAEALLEPTADGESVVRDALRLGIRGSDLLIGCVQPLLYDLGERYVKGLVTEGDEQRFTASAEHIISMMASRQEPGPSSSAVDVLLVCAEGNYHVFGVRFLELVLREHGIGARAIYPSLPAEEVVGLMRRLRPKILGVSVALPQQMEAVARLGDLIEVEVQRSDYKPLLFVGGQTVTMHGVAPGGAFQPYSGNLDWLLGQIKRTLTTSPRRPGRRKESSGSVL